jgi:hypothetical protein
MLEGREPSCDGLEDVDPRPTATTHCLAVQGKTQFLTGEVLADLLPVTGTGKLLRRVLKEQNG